MYRRESDSRIGGPPDVDFLSSGVTDRFRQVGGRDLPEPDDLVQRLVPRDFVGFASDPDDCSGPDRDA